MKRWTIRISALLATVVPCVAAFLYLAHRATYIEQAERELNRLYREYRPFAYRWKGAPAGGVVRNECHFPQETTRRATIAIDRAEQRFGWTLQVLQLSGRLALLQGRFDDALAAYRRALYSRQNNPELKLELGITYAVRAACENRPLDYEFAMEEILALETGNQSPELIFDTAVLLGTVCLPHASLDRWRLVIQREPSTEWRNEAYLRLAKAQYALMTWDQHLHEISDSPSSYLAHTYDAAKSIEVVLATALQDWLPNLHRNLAADAALTQFAVTLRQSGDFWLTDLLQTQDSPDAVMGMQLLAIAVKANSQGEHIRAAKSALLAERFFRGVGNAAGVLRSRVELAYSLDRRWQQNPCLAVIHGVQEEADRRHYTWIAAQAWLERISCSTQTRKSDVIADSEAAYKSIAQTRYTGLQLRALSFLTEQYFSFDRRLRIWTYGLQGLRSFWNHPLPPNRGYTFYYTLGSSARSAGNGRAALALLREGVGVLKDSTYRQLYALGLSDLGEWEFQQGFREEAKRTFEEMDKVFGRLDPKETASFHRLAEIARARLDINAGDPHDGLSRLLTITSDMKFPYATLSPTEQRVLLPVLGEAYLRMGNIKQAGDCYGRAIWENIRSLETIHDHAQRENSQQEIAPAWKGQTEILLRKGQASKALESWENYREGRLTATFRTFVSPPDGVSLLVFAFLPTGLSAWLRDRNGIQQQWLAGDGIGDAVRQFSLLASDPGSLLDQVDAESKRLYRSLIRPFESRLLNTKLLVIDADGPLAGIPWIALKDEAERVLLEKFAVVQTIGWAEAESHFAQRSVSVDKAVIFSNPTIGEALRVRFSPLTDAQREADWLQQQLPHPTVCPGRAATVENLARHLPHSTLFHFAGHGMSYGGFGALLLAPSLPSNRDAQYVTADDIAALDLRSLQLVVLPACSSGIGENEGTVNLDSLVRGFLEAGAWRVIATRWNVLSQPTTDIIVQFYQLVLQGYRPSDALREAILEFRQHHPMSHPYSWAGFQIFGTP